MRSFTEFARYASVQDDKKKFNSIAKKITSTLIVLFILSSCAFTSKADRFSFKRMEIKGYQFRVAVADNSEKRARGLMFVGALPHEEGMLFVFPEEEKLAFWMKNTKVPLSVAFIDSKKRIVDIQDMEPLREDKTYQSKEKAKYALEVNQGWFEEKGIKVGDTAKF
jgi:uncharacterized membrane protein (UPF0127 family)